MESSPPGFSEGDWKETTADPWRKQCVLSLDGGGIRGYSSLLILKRLMELVDQYEKDNFEGSPGEPDRLLPCYYFDYMAGTSTGGLISIMLGRMRMSIDECITQYKVCAKEVFGHPRTFHRLLKRPKYDSRRLGNYIEQMVKIRAPMRRDSDSDDELESFVYSKGHCRTLVLSAKLDNHGVTPHMFRSYNIATEKEDKDQGITIWEVARATSAAAFYFNKTKIRGQKFLGGSFVAADCTTKAMEEVERMNSGGFARPDGGGVQPRGIFGVILSIGTGNPPQVSKWPMREPIIKRKTGLSSSSSKHSGLKRIFSPSGSSDDAVPIETDQTVKKLQKLSEELGVPYFRFNTQQDLRKLDVDDYDLLTLKLIRESTTSYVKKPDVERELKKIASRLVHIRRLRMEHSRSQGSPRPDRPTFDYHNTNETSDPKGSKSGVTSRAPEPQFESRLEARLKFTAEPEPISGENELPKSGDPAEGTTSNFRSQLEPTQTHYDENETVTIGAALIPPDPPIGDCFNIWNYSPKSDSRSKVDMKLNDLVGIPSLSQSQKTTQMSQHRHGGFSIMMATVLSVAPPPGVSGIHNIARSNTGNHLAAPNRVSGTSERSLNSNSLNTDKGASTSISSRMRNETKRWVLVWHMFPHEVLHWRRKYEVEPSNSSKWVKVLDVPRMGPVHIMLDNEHGITTWYRTLSLNEHFPFTLRMQRLRKQLKLYLTRDRPE